MTVRFANTLPRRLQGGNLLGKSKFIDWFWILPKGGMYLDVLLQLQYYCNDMIVDYWLSLWHKTHYMGLLHPGACLHRPSLELVSPVFTGHLFCLEIFKWRLSSLFDSHGWVFFGNLICVLILSIWRKIWREEWSEMTVRTVGGKICLKRKPVLWKARLVHLSKYLCKEGEAGNQQSQEPSHPDPHRSRTQQSNQN